MQEASRACACTWKELARYMHAHDDPTGLALHVRSLITLADTPPMAQVHMLSDDLLGKMQPPWTEEAIIELLADCL